MTKARVEEMQFKQLTLLRSYLVPATACALCLGLYFTGNFQMVYAALIVIVASFVEHGKNGFRALGFQSKNFNALNLLVFAPLLGIAMFCLWLFVLVPGVPMITGQPLDYSIFDQFVGDLPAVLFLGGYIWASAALGEEIVFRGFLMRQFSKFFGNSWFSLTINIVLFAVLFGYLHAYQGLSGQIVSGIGGAIWALVFHFRKSDLWVVIFGHGLYDTMALAMIYFGISPQ